MTDGKRPTGVVDRDGLGVLDVGSAGRGIANVTDGDPARELAQLILREGVLHEAHGSVGVELLAVARDDAGRLLAAMLERVKPEVRDVGGLGMAEDTEDAARVVEVVVVVQPCRRTSAWVPRRIENDDATLWVGHGRLEPNRAKARPLAATHRCEPDPEAGEEPSGIPRQRSSAARVASGRARAVRTRQRDRRDEKHRQGGRGNRELHVPKVDSKVLGRQSRAGASCVQAGASLVRDGHLSRRGQSIAS